MRSGSNAARRTLPCVSAEATTYFRLKRASVGVAGLHSLRGIAALADGRAREAVPELLKADEADPCTVCTLPWLAEAYAQSGDTASAISTYERYLSTPWVWRFETDAPHLAWRLRQLGDLYARTGQQVKADAQVARLRQLWRKADVDKQ